LNGKTFKKLIQCTKYLLFNKGSLYKVGALAQESVKGLSERGREVGEAQCGGDDWPWVGTLFCKEPQLFTCCYTVKAALGNTETNNMSVS
jgi:hypothetical protein